MASKLKDYFPLIREREEVLAEIRKSRGLNRKFNNWTKQQQEEFLAMCTGVKGLKLLYDGFFKEVMNPEYVPERLGGFLSCLLDRELKVIHAIPMDSTRIADESVLMAMDIVVQLSDGSIANVEMQRTGYLFPGQRSACYSADLLLRQYKRVRGKKKNFSYHDVKSVYTIVLFEKSPRIFHQYPDTWRHYFRQMSDTGLEVELLQKYLFIPLDIYTKNRQNRNIESKRDAWLSLFTSQDPDRIIELAERYPEFKDIYEEGYEICRNMENVMGIFSKELYILDRNTERFMFEEMQRESEEIKREIEQIQKKKEQMQKEKERIQKEKEQIQEENKQMQKEKEQIQKENEQIQKENEQVQKENEQIQRDNKEIQRKNEQIQKELNELHQQSLRNTVSILRDVGLSDEEIITRLCTQYRLEEEQVKGYL